MSLPIHLPSGDFIWYTEKLLGGDSQPATRVTHGDAAGDATTTGDATTDDDCSGDDGVPRLRPVAVLLPPDGKLLPKGLPSQHFGSDHVCLMSVFELSCRDSKGCVAQGST